MKNLKQNWPGRLGRWRKIQQIFCQEERCQNPSPKNTKSPEMCGVTKVDCLISCRGILSVKLTIFEPPPQKKMNDFGSHDFFGEVTSTWPFTVKKKISLGEKEMDPRKFLGKGNVASVESIHLHCGGAWQLAYVLSRSLGRVIRFDLRIFFDQMGWWKNTSRVTWTWRYWW